MLEFCPLGMEKHPPSTTSSRRDLPRLSESSLERCSLAIACSRHQGRQAMVCPLRHQRLHLPIAAIRGGNRRRGGRSRGRSGTRGGHRSQPMADTAPAATGVPAADPTPSDLARASSGLCHFHLFYADKVGKCVAPCSWGTSTLSYLALWFTW
jgi:hypothetical protein